MTTRHYVALRKVDLGSEFLRFLGPNRGWVVAVWKWLFPVFQASVYISTYLHIYISTCIYRRALSTTSRTPNTVTRFSCQA